MKNRKISVIMPSYLGYYDGCAKNRVEKFHRAIDSFLTQTYTNKELIVISDGCKETIQIIENKYKNPDIRLVRIPKQELFSGNVRQAGLDKATGRIICYMDSDDFIGDNHLKTLQNEFNEEFTWSYFNDYIYLNRNHVTPRIVNLEMGSVGTSSIAHLNMNPFLKFFRIKWSGFNGYGHDWLFIQKLMKKHSYQKIMGMEYFVCHMPNKFDS